MPLGHPELSASELWQHPLHRRETKLDTLKQKRWLVTLHWEFLWLRV